VAGFIQRIEKSDAAFQRQMSRAKVAAIENLYETAVNRLAESSPLEVICAAGECALPVNQIEVEARPRAGVRRVPVPALSFRFDVPC
jgi:hypothetical protein